MNKLEEFNLELKKKKIAVIGVGVSNIPLLDYLKDLSANVTIFDKKEITIDMSKYNFKVFTGNDYLTNLKGFDIIFRSPSCLPTTKELVEEANRGAYITTEVEEVIRLTPAKVIGITGSDGKTTTTTLISKVLEANNYHVFLGGNIGVPLFTKIKDMTEDDIVVLELSSFQLMNMRVSPSISVITNISPNHLDYHKDYQEYIDAKTCIYKNSDGILVLNKDNEITSKLTSTREIRYFSRYQKTNYFYVSDNNIYYKDKLIINTKDLHIRGVHNYENICTCLTAIIDLIDLDKSIEVIKKFSGVEHRIEFVREINGVKWYNDSVSSSPTRTIAGLNSFTEPIVLIAGGYDKNLDYTPLAKPILEHVKQLILFGSTKDKIFNAVTKEKTNENIEIHVLNTLEEVVNKAKEVSNKGDVVLFSPASASFDLFKNFADRGLQFKELVKKIPD